MKVVSDANVYCFDQRGMVVRWDHELNEVERLDKSFFEVLEFELGELANRKELKIAEN